MIADAESILKVCGLGSYLHIGCGKSTLVFELLKRSADAFGLDISSEVIAENETRAPGRFFQGELTKYPFDAESFDNIVIGNELLNYNFEQLAVLLSAVKLMAKRNIVLYFSPEVYGKMHHQYDLMQRAGWEELLLQAGLRKHPRASVLQHHTSFHQTQLAQISFFERMPEQAFEQYPSAIIQTHVSPYIDPLRQTGQAADNILSRYSLINQKIRSGDVVLELGCKTGHGAAILAAGGKAKQIIGIDADNDVLAYAAQNYAQHNAMISFQKSDLTNLKAIENHTIDLIIAIDVMDKIDNKSAFLAEIKRVLKPDGRFVGSVPCMWKDNSGLTLNS
ncbi:MAG: methyltransferase domain-containing protein, partial [Gammaproteobacteria bacterium]